MCLKFQVQNIKSHQFGPNILAEWGGATSGGHSALVSMLSRVVLTLGYFLCYNL